MLYTPIRVGIGNQTNTPSSFCRSANYGFNQRPMCARLLFGMIVDIVAASMIALPYAISSLGLYVS